MDLVTPNPYQNNLETISNKIVKFILKILLQEYGTDCLGLVEFRSLLHIPFMFHILPGRCEFTQPDRGKKKKLPTKGTFFWFGLHER